MFNVRAAAVGLAASDGCAVAVLVSATAQSAAIASTSTLPFHQRDMQLPPVLMGAGTLKGVNVATLSHRSYLVKRRAWRAEVSGAYALRGGPVEPRTTSSG